MKFPTIKLPPRLYWFVVGVVAVAFMGTLGGCFGLAFSGQEIPQFALDQLKWMAVVLGGILSVPRSPSAPDDDTISPDDAPDSPSDPGTE